MRTIDDGTNDRVDLAVTGGRAGEALCDGRDESLGLKGFLQRGSAGGRGAQRPGDAAGRVHQLRAQSTGQWTDTHFFSILTVV